MSKRHKIPASRLVKIPHALTPMRPQKGEFMRFTTPLPMTEWNVPTLRAVAKFCCCSVTQEAAKAELLTRGAA